MIEMLTTLGGTTDGIETVAGAVIELGPIIEEQMVRQGYARYVKEAVKPAPVIETAERPAPPENTAKRTRKTPPRKAVK